MAITHLALTYTSVETAQSPFFKLAIATTLNLAACYLKLKDIFKMGQLCCMVLRYDHDNVKALFKRAVAALELGKRTIAYDDILKVLKIDPNNREASKMLRDMSSSWLRREDSGKCYVKIASLKTERVEREEIAHLTLDNNLSPDQTSREANSGNQESLLRYGDLPLVDTLMAESGSSAVVLEDLSHLHEEV